MDLKKDWTHFFRFGSNQSRAHLGLKRMVLFYGGFEKWHV